MSDSPAFHKITDRQPQGGEMVYPRRACLWGHDYLGRCVWKNGLWINTETDHWWFDDNTEWTAEQLTAEEEEEKDGCYRR